MSSLLYRTSICNAVRKIINVNLIICIYTVKCITYLALVRFSSLRILKTCTHSAHMLQSYCRLAVVKEAHAGNGKRPIKMFVIIILNYP